MGDNNKSALIHVRCALYFLVFLAMDASKDSEKSQQDDGGIVEPGVISIDSEKASISATNTSELSEEQGSETCSTASSHSPIDHQEYFLGITFTFCSCCFWSYEEVS